MCISGKKTPVGVFALTLASLGGRPGIAFQAPSTLAKGRDLARGAASTFLASSVAVEVEASAEAPALNPEAIRLKEDLVALGEATRRGFSASKVDRDKARRIVDGLARLSPSNEPAAAYYGDGDGGQTDRSSLAGKWTLIYTDAPDITGLEGGPFSTAKLGRIGQDCDPPSIKNVIEWKKPEWASSLPFGGGESSRVLQKVCCEGSSAPENPKMVDLKILGLELSGMSESDADGGGLNALLNGPAALLESNPVKFQGPLSAPFGKFDILYLDDGMRITRTFQGYLAVNLRAEDENEWF